MEIQESKAAYVRGLEKEGSCPWSLGALLSGQSGKCYLLASSEPPCSLGPHQPARGTQAMLTGSHLVNGPVLPFLGLPK